MLGSTSKVTSLATSAGVGSVFGANPLPCFSASISSALTWSTMRSNSSCSCGVALDVESAREHQIDGAIEVGLGFGKLPSLVVGFAQGICLLNLRDQRLNLALVEG